jgi:hypothetical protein
LDIEEQHGLKAESTSSNKLIPEETFSPTIIKKNRMLNFKKT